MEAYRRAFIQTGSLAPLKHVMVRRPPRTRARNRPDELPPELPRL